MNAKRSQLISVDADIDFDYARYYSSLHKWTIDDRSLHQIRQNLYLGSVEARFQVRRLGIKTVICVISNEEYDKGSWQSFQDDSDDELDISKFVNEYYYSLDDRDEEEIIPVVQKALPIIEASLANNQPVLVHCLAGRFNNR